MYANSKEEYDAMPVEPMGTALLHGISSGAGAGAGAGVGAAGITQGQQSDGSNKKDKKGKKGKKKRGRR
jgi:hypothetical protein